VIAETRKQLGKFGDKMAVPVKKVGEIAIKKTLRGKILIIPGFLPKMMASILRILPRKTATAIYNRVGKK
jgi:short-subunit dehydrogenase